MNKLLYNDMVDERDLLRISETLLLFPIDLERTLRIFGNLSLFHEKNKLRESICIVR